MKGSILLTALCVIVCANASASNILSGGASLTLPGANSSPETISTDVIGATLGLHDEDSALADSGTEKWARPSSGPFRAASASVTNVLASTDELSSTSAPCAGEGNAPSQRDCAPDGTSGSGLTIEEFWATAPVPAVVWMFGLALLGITIVARRRDRKYL